MPVRTDSTRSTFSGTDVALVLALALMWGVSFLFIKVAVTDVSPLWVVAGRTSIGAGVLAVILVARGRRLPTDRALWKHLAIIGLMSNMLPWLLLAWAEQDISSGLASVLNALVPSMTLVVAVAVGIERLTVHRVAGLFLALGGTVVAVWSELGSGGDTLATLAVVAATILYGIGTVYAKRHVSGRLGALDVAAGQILVSAVVTTIAALAFSGLPTGLELDSAGALVGLGALGTGLAFVAFYELLERVGPTSATLVTYLIPVVGLTAGAVVLGERFGANVIVGLGIIISGIWLAQRESLPAGGPEPEFEVLVRDG
ncbi:MAG: DMT family transporter [Nitriliruptorales bacterium]|nr:DMT family transporter [Nitriliruptorales bacterium]